MTRSLDDARAEHARGELDDEGLDDDRAARRRPARRRAAAALAALAPERSRDPSPRRGPSGRAAAPSGSSSSQERASRSSSACSSSLRSNPFARAVHPRAPTTTSGKVQALLYEAELLVKGQHQLRALTAYDAVLSLAPRNPEALVESGWLRYEFPGLGAHDAAQVALGAAELARAVRLAPRSAAAHLY